MSETRIVVMGDNHGSEADADTLNAILRFCRDFKPHYRVHLGDNWEMACLMKGLDPTKRQAAWESLEDDVTEGCKWLREYRPTHFLMGNHDDRVRDAMEHTDSITKLEALQKIDRVMKRAIREAGVRHFREYNVHDGFLDIGKLTVTHGYAHSKDAAEKMAHRYIAAHGGSIVMGHLHRHEQLNVERRGGGAAWICGCACNLKPTYARRNMSSLKWQHGFIAFKVGKDGVPLGRQGHRFNGKWEMPFSK